MTCKRLKSNCTKSELKSFRKRNYTNFRKELFRRHVKHVLKHDYNANNFNDNCIKAIDIHTSVKTTTFWCNTKPHISHILQNK